MDYLVLENARLDRIHEQLVQGIIPAEPIMSAEVARIYDSTGGFIVVDSDAPAPRRKRIYLGKAWTAGPIARKLRSDTESLFSMCAHCHPTR